ncbi:MAG TPA: hypothetical protein HPP80_07030 [Rhodospirillaceae bacterium]|nr:hypothetical protein [Rhodospirillaceae bacterium]
MLDAFRRASQTWFIKILFGILVLAFSSWGIGDVIRLRAEATPAIVVGKQSIAASEVAEQVHRDLERLAPAFGGKLSIEQAKAMGLLRRSIDQMVWRSLMDQNARALWLEPDDETLRRTIAATPAFQNQLHVFDKAVYLHAMQRAGFANDKQFVDAKRQDIARDQLVRLIADGAVFPETVARPLFVYHHEQRIAETVSFTAEKMPMPSRPDDKVLENFYKANSAKFMSPEMRGLTAVVLLSAELAEGFSPDDQTVERAYQARLGEFQTSEKRSLQQVLFDDQGKALAFLEDAKKLGNIAAAAKAAKLDLIDLGWVTKQELPLPALADAAFGTAAPGLYGPVQSPLGWHVVAVSATTPGKTRPLAEMRAQIVRDLKKEEATNRLYAQSTALEDAIGAGNGMDEAAASVNVKPLKIAAVDRHGLGPDGKPVPGLPMAAEFIETAFQTSAGSNSEVAQFKDGSGYFVLHVENVAAPQLKPFDLVKDQVFAAWSQEAKLQEAARQAEAAQARLRRGDSLVEAVRPLIPSTSPPLKRTNDPQGVAGGLASAVFKLSKPGDTTLVKTADGEVLARLKAIIPADIKAETQDFNKTRAQLADALGEDLLQQYLAGLDKEMGVHINTAAIDQQFEK